MRELTGNLWAFRGEGVIVITTNGYVTRDGRAVLGQGVARQAGERFPGLPRELGEKIRTGGNHVHKLTGGLVSFPVEDSPWALPDIRLIRRSAEELRGMADRNNWSLIVVPRPGCGGGGLDWNDVAPALEEFFDDRFHVITAVPGMSRNQPVAGSAVRGRG